MKKYSVLITEYLSTTIVVEASSEEAAEEIVRMQYNNNEIILDYNHYDDTTFNVIED